MILRKLTANTFVLAIILMSKKANYKILLIKTYLKKKLQYSRHTVQII